jgi:hypothetical protein
MHPRLFDALQNHVVLLRALDYQVRRVTFRIYPSRSGNNSLENPAMAQIHGLCCRRAARWRRVGLFPAMCRMNWFANCAKAERVGGRSGARSPLQTAQARVTRERNSRPRRRRNSACLPESSRSASGPEGSEACATVETYFLFTMQSLACRDVDIAVAPAS